MTVQYATLWESGLTPQQHREISYVLRTAYRNDALFPGPRSWAGVRPELRVIATTSVGVVGHLAVKRHFIRVDGVDQLVAETGLWAVHPDVQGQGIGPALIKRCNEALAGLKVPFGYTNVAHGRALRLRLAHGWHAVEGTRTRFCDLDYPVRLREDDYPAVILPVAARLEDWPQGTLIDLNGHEL
jgi:nodulation protein A